MVKHTQKNTRNITKYKPLTYYYHATDAFRPNYWELLGGGKNKWKQTRDNNIVIRYYYEYTIFSIYIAVSVLIIYNTIDISIIDIGVLCLVLPKI